MFHLPFNALYLDKFSPKMESFTLGGNCNTTLYLTSQLSHSSCHYSAMSHGRPVTKSLTLWALTLARHGGLVLPVLTLFLCFWTTLCSQSQWYFFCCKRQV